MLKLLIFSMHAALGNRCSLGPFLIAHQHPDGKSAPMLVTARLKYVAESEWGARRYLHVTLLDE